MEPDDRLETYNNHVEGVEMTRSRLKAALNGFASRPPQTRRVQTENQSSTSQGTDRSGEVNPAEFHFHSTSATTSDENTRSVLFPNWTYRPYNSRIQYIEPPLAPSVTADLNGRTPRTNSISNSEYSGNVSYPTGYVSHNLSHNTHNTSTPATSPLQNSSHSPSEDINQYLEVIEDPCSELENTGLFPSDRPFRRLKYTENFCSEETNEEVKDQEELRSNLTRANTNYSRIARPSSTEANHNVQSSRYSSQMQTICENAIERAPDANYFPLYNEDSSQFYKRKRLQAQKTKKLNAILENQYSKPPSYYNASEFQKVVDEVRQAGARAFYQTSGFINSDCSQIPSTAAEKHSEQAEMQDYLHGSSATRVASTRTDNNSRPQNRIDNQRRCSNSSVKRDSPQAAAMEARNHLYYPNREGYQNNSSPSSSKNCWFQTSSRFDRRQQRQTRDGRYTSTQAVNRQLQFQNSGNQYVPSTSSGRSSSLARATTEGRQNRNDYQNYPRTIFARSEASSSPAPRHQTRHDYQYGRNSSSANGTPNTHNRLQYEHRDAYKYSPQSNSAWFENRAQNTIRNEYQYNSNFSQKHQNTAGIGIPPTRNSSEDHVNLNNRWPPPSSTNASQVNYFPTLLSTRDLFIFNMNAEEFDEPKDENEAVQVKPNSKPPTPPLPVRASEINYVGRNLLDLGANLRREPFVTPAQIPNDVQNLLSNGSQVSRLLGWAPPTHDTYDCSSCGFQEPIFEPEYYLD